MLFRSLIENPSTIEADKPVVVGGKVIQKGPPKKLSLFSLVRRGASAVQSKKDLNLKVLLTDREFSETIGKALERLRPRKKQLAQFKLRRGLRVRLAVRVEGGYGFSHIPTLASARLPGVNAAESRLAGPAFRDGL